MNIFWFCLLCSTCDFEVSIITQSSFLTFHGVPLINYYTICKEHSNYLKHSCISRCNHKLLYDLNSTSGSLFWARHSDGLLQQNQLIKLGLTTTQSKILRAILRYSEALEPVTCPISTAQSLKRVKSTAVVVSICFSWVHSPAVLRVP